MSKIYCVDAKTGSKVLRDMTEAEEKRLADGIKTTAASKKAHEDALAKKETDQAAATAKLKALGLTDDEIVALIN
tara:strand:+ start:97 stop:321 length:225 start_codon:yes stop_codon:yes gene_type:complete